MEFKVFHLLQNGFRKLLDALRWDRIFHQIPFYENHPIQNWLNLRLLHPCVSHPETGQKFTGSRIFNKISTGSTKFQPNGCRIGNFVLKSLSIIYGISGLILFLPFYSPSKPNTRFGAIVNVPWGTTELNLIHFSSISSIIRSILSDYVVSLA